MPRVLRAFLLVFAVVVSGACTGDDDAGGAQDAEAGAGASEDASDGDGEPSIRFCDAYLDYLGDRSPANLEVVVEASSDPDVEALAAIITSDDPTGRVVAADADLEDLARRRCQPEWIAGAQGAGNTAAAAEAMADALRAGDRFGARNIASANAIASLEPWEPLPESDAVQVLEVGGQAFTILFDERLAECQVETGVVLACTVVG